MTDQGTRSPDRPPCASLMLEVLGPNSTQYDLDRVNQAGQLATRADCLNCQNGDEIICPVQPGQAPLEGSVVVEIRQMPQGALIHFKKTYEKGPSSKRIWAFISQVADHLQRLGIYQNPKSIEPPEIANLQDAAIPPLRQEVQISATQASSTEPECPKLLANFIKQRTTTIEEWRKTEVPKDRSKRQPINHSTNELTYHQAIQAAERADAQKDCPSCHKAENCVVRNRVPPKVFYDTVHKKRRLKSERAIRLSETVVFLGSGHSRDEIPPEETRVLDRRQEQLVEQYGGMYLDSV